MRTTLILVSALLLIATNAAGATLTQLLGSKQAVQCYLNSAKAGQVRCRHLNSGDDWAVHTQPSGTVEAWVGGLNRGATKLVLMSGKQTAVVNIDGSNFQTVTASGQSSGHFWRDGSGNDWIVYLGELENKSQIGSTWRVRINAQTNTAVESTREKLVSQQYSAGLGGSGTYLVESYGKSFLYNRNSKQKSVHLNGVQNCVGSPHAGDKPWMMYERDTPHHHVVISEWNETNNTARYIWQYDAGSKIVFGQWSPTDAEFATIHEKASEAATSVTLKLVKLQVDTSGTGDKTGSYQQASMGLDHGYLGGVWVGNSFSAPSSLSPPVAPEQLGASAASATGVDLNWQDRSNNESGFKIERKQGSGSFSQIATVAAGNTSYANTALRASTRYVYRVRAYNDAGNSAFSNEASATTEDPPPEPPAAPDSLEARAASPDQIDLNWHDGSNNESGFKIERKQGSGSFAQIATVGAGETSYADDGVQASTRYTYRVRAYNGAGNSAFSNEASATTEDPPPEPSISITDPTGGEIWEPGSTQHIRWTVQALTDIKILFSPDNGETWQTVSGSVDTTEDTWTDYPWVVPASPCETCLLRIQGYSDEAPTTSGAFAIRSAAADGGTTDGDQGAADASPGDASPGDASPDDADRSSADAGPPANTEAGSDPANRIDGTEDGWTLAGGCALNPGDHSDAFPGSKLCLLALLLCMAARRRRS